MSTNLKSSTMGGLAVKPFPTLTVLVAVGLINMLLLGIACGNGNQPDPGADAVARVGTKDITLREVDSVIKQQLDGSGGVSFTPVELLAARLSVLENLIQEEALYQRAQRDNLVPDEGKVNQEIQRRIQEAGITEETYRKQIEEAGLTEVEFKDKIKRELAISQLRERERARVTAPTDAEIEKYFNDRRAEFRAQRGVDLSIIVADPVNTGLPDDAIGEAQAEYKIRAVYEQLRAGTDFATIATQRSEHQSSLRGGSLGFAPEATLRQTFASIPQISERLMAMSTGQYTEPIRDPASGAWIIFKVNTKREREQDLTLDEVRRTIITRITEQRQQVLLTALVMVAMSEANVRNTLAQRIVDNPRTIVELRPSPLLESAMTPDSEPRIEDEPPADSRDSDNQGAGANANR